jgi:hypothetical protein
MWNRDEAGAIQPGARGDDVMMRDARWMIDEDCPAGIEQSPQCIAGEFVARRELDRTATDNPGRPMALPRLHDRRVHQPESRLREIA